MSILIRAFSERSWCLQFATSVTSIYIWLRKHRVREKIKRRRLREPIEVARRTSTAADPEGPLDRVSRVVMGQGRRSGPKSRRMTRIGRIVAVAVGCAALNTGGAAQSPIQQTLSVPAAASSTPSLAVVGRYVAAVWTATANGTTNVYFAMSDNGGATFSSPRRVNEQDGDAGATNEQPPRVAISGSGTSRTFTVLWSKRDLGPQDTRRDIIRISRSTDGGRTFSPARLTHDQAFSGARGWQSLAAGANGVLHAVWLDGRQAGSKIAAMAHKGTPHKGQPPQEVYHGVLTADGRMIETRIAEDVCFCCKTAVSVDQRGHVYAAWRHIFPGSMRDIAFAKSTDGGKSFSPLVRVSEDNWQLNGCPEDGPSLAVDPSGAVHIAWATVVNDADEPRKALFYATSRDGKVFSPRIRVGTNGASTPGHPQLTLISNGSAAIVFDEAIGGNRRVSFARVTPSGEVQPPQVLSGEESATHPVIAGTAAGSVLVAWTSRSNTPSSLSTIQLRQIR